ncbi:ribonuclease Y-like [Clytia hemisphaerica]|uniref:ribonuclease Y-like n=1 Tax=Clytia hemisphaerica TaxID=252671 RepID=UPI0034D3AA92
MASKRIETSKQRLFEKIEEGKKYLKEKENIYEVNELTRLRNAVAKKNAQFEKDIQEYEKSENKDEEKVTKYQDFQVEAEDILDDLEHYIETTKEKFEREEREKIRQLEAEEKKSPTRS